MWAGRAGTVVQLYTNIKEHSSKVLTNTATSSLSSLCLFNKKNNQSAFLETVVGLENNRKCCTSTLLSVCWDFYVLNGHKHEELIDKTAVVHS